MADKRIKSCSTSLAIRETEIKTTRRFCFTPSGVAIIKKKEKCGPSICKNAENADPSHITGDNVLHCSYSGKWLVSSSQIKQRVTIQLGRFTSEY